MWSASDFSRVVSRDGVDADISELVHWAYAKVGRTDFSQPGFGLIDLGADSSSEALRRLMVALLREMRSIHRSTTGLDLVCLWAARFDQQVSTRPHRDGGADQSVLMLGYEPSEARAELALADYAKAAFDAGVTPAEFLETQNPMFQAGEEWLRPYATPVSTYSNRSYQILFINNSITPYSVDRPAWQGVLHTATILNASDALRRVVNSVMIASVLDGTPEVVTESQLGEFATTRVVRRRGYDRLDVEDDR